jgi:serine/threonine-protein kinase
MTNEKWPEVKRIFQEAIELPPSEREAFIAQACGTDLDLCSEVESLIASHELAQDFIDEPVASIAVGLIHERIRKIEAGQRIGKYRIIRQIGHGGMGVVFLAERDDVGGEVAIKVLENVFASPARQQRFLSEEKTLAGLKHEYIAQLHDVGILDDGTPWFAMEYVDGKAITELPADVSMDERLKLFRLVCKAVQYAHGQMVVHRDLKPSNILVRSTGGSRTPKLLDFGISKHLGNVSDSPDPGLTGRLMSFLYAAPEQFKGMTSVQTDVYSLGVVLYELIAGCHPFKLRNESPLEIERMISENTPEKPSLVASRRGDRTGQPQAGTWTDLDVLCLKTLHREPGRRYQSVEALIRDIDHYLAGQPLEARGDSVTYKLGKFAKRHRSGLTASLTVIVLALTFGIFFTVRLAQARNQALFAASRTQRIEGFISKLLTGGGQPSADLKVVTLIDDGAIEAQTLNKDPEVQAELYQTLGNSYRHLGVFDKADSLLSRALSQRQSLYGPEHAQVAESLIALGLLRMDQRKLDEAEKLVRDGLQMTQRVSPDDKIALASAMTALGSVLSTRGSHNDAIPVIEEAVKVLDSSVPTQELLEALIQLSEANFYAAHYDTCDTLTQRTKSIAQQLYGDRHFQVGKALMNLGAVQIQRGNYPEAEQLYRQSLDITQGWYGKEHFETASNMIQLAQSLIAQKRYDEAESLLSQALEINEKVFSKDHPRLTFVLNELGSLAYRRGNYTDAEKYFLRTVELNRQAYGETNFRTLVAQGNLAGVYYTQHYYDRAESTLRQVVNGYALESPDHLNLGIAKIKLGRALARTKKFKEAESQALAGYEIVKKHKSQSWIKDARATLVIIYEGLSDSEKVKIFSAPLQEP